MNTNEMLRAGQGFSLEREWHFVLKGLLVLEKNPNACNNADVILLDKHRWPHKHL